MAIVIPLALVGWQYYETKIVPTHNVSSLCNDPNGISKHVYNPSRLQTLASCITVTGIASRTIQEADGDMHIWITLNAANSSYSNSPDIHNGDLVAEIVCVYPITQWDATGVCGNYTNQIALPASGDNVIVSGPYVLDTLHNWKEIHPVYSLTISS